MKTLGVDQSYTSTGWCLNHNDQMTHFGIIKSKGNSTYERAADVANTLVALVKQHKVDLVNCENLAFGMRGDATRDLAGLLYVIVTSLQRECPTVKIGLIAPTSNKKRATGKGTASKRDMIDALPEAVLTQFKEKNFKVTTGLADLADSYWLSTDPQKH